MIDKAIFLDCEANGLHGTIFAAAASIQTRDHGETATWSARCPIVGEVDEWVAEHVIPALEDHDHGIPVDAYNPAVIMSRWADLYSDLKDDGYAVIAHVSWPIEARFLWATHANRPFSGPYPLLDVAGNLDQAGYDPTSVDGYLLARGIQPPPGVPHNPLYDARAEALAYWDLTS
jgi:hypothetical protein